MQSTEINTPKKFKRYTSLNVLLKNLFAIPIKDIENSSIGTDKGEIPFSIFKKNVEQQGIWGYVDRKTNVVCFWMNDTVTFEMLLTFIAHETGHLNGRVYKDVLKEEKKACMYDSVTSFAYTKALELYNEKSN